MSLPPLPNHSLEWLSGHREPVKTYDEDDIKAYGQACRAAALEEAALACESAISSIWDYHDDGRKQIGTTVCNNLAAAIRKIKEQA